MNFNQVSDIKSLISKYAARLSPREELEALFPMVLVMYSIKEGIKLTFNDDDQLEMEEKPDDDLWQTLHEVSVASHNTEYAFEDVADFYSSLMDVIGEEDFSSFYPEAIDLLRIFVKGLYNGTNAMPRFFVSRTIANIVKAHGCRSVYNPMCGIASLALALDDGIEYFGQEATGSLAIFADVMLDAFGKKNASVEDSSYEDYWYQDEYEALVSVLPVNYSFDQVDYWERYAPRRLKSQYEFLSELMDSESKPKIAVLMMHYDICNGMSDRNGDYQTLRERICESGCLDTVITLPDSVFSDVKALTSIVVLDFEEKHDKVRFVAAEKGIRTSFLHMESISGQDIDLIEKSPLEMISEVSVQQMKDVDYSFNAYVYLDDAVAEDGQELVRLRDLVTLESGHSKYPMEDAHIRISSFSKDIEMAIRQVEFKEPLYRYDDNYYVKGPAVFFRVGKDWSISACLNKTKDTCSVDWLAYALKPRKGKIMLEYLAYVLLTDKSLSKYISHIKEYYMDDLRFSHLLNRKVPVYTDLKKQESIVERFRPITPKVMEYNVILASSEEGTFTKEVREALEKERLHVVSVADSVEGAGGLTSLLETYVRNNKSASTSVDAVIVDPLVRLDAAEQDDYEGFDQVVVLAQEYALHDKIPFYLYSSKDMETLWSEAGIKRNRRSYFMERPRLFAQDMDGLSGLMKELKSELESIGSIDTKIRSHYRNFFEAASWYDQTYGQLVCDIVSKYIRQDYIDNDGDVDRPFNDIRIFTDSIVKILRERNIVPQSLDNGAVASLLKDSKYDSTRTGTLYSMRVQLMPKETAAALKTIYELGNEGSHNIVLNSNLGRSIIFSFMDVITWLYENRDLIGETRHGFYQEFNKGKKTVDITIRGTVKCEIVDGSPYYYCEGVHLKVNDSCPEVKVGDSVRIDKPSMESTPRPNLGVVFYSLPKNKEKVNDPGYYVE